jgi:GT2 family glycosyltransferase
VPGFAAHPLAKPYPGYGGSALCARKSFFNRIGGFNPALYHGDVKDWFLRAAEQGAVIEVLPDILVYRRLHETNMSHYKAAVSREDSLQLVKASLDRRRAGGTASRVSPLSLPNGDEGK